MNRQDTDFLEGLKHSIYLISPPGVREQLYDSLCELLLQGQQDLLIAHGQTLSFGEIFSRVIDIEAFMRYLSQI